MSSNVVIIGAGAAGLTAGYHLQRQGVNCTILEASSILGGRLRKSEGLADFPIDLGGEWIHVDTSILDEIVDDPTVSVDVETIRHSYGPTFVWTGLFWVPVPYSRFSLDSLFVNYTWYDFYNDYVASDIQDRIFYDCQVDSIDYDEDPIQVGCVDGRNFVADQVIVATPVKMLQLEQIDFSPPLPEDKRWALNQVDFPPGLKVFIEFQTRFYFDGFLLLDWPGNRYFWEESFGEDSEKRVLGAFIRGPSALRYDGLSDDQIVESLLHELDALFDGQATPSFVGAVVQNWSVEPFVQGTYSTYRYALGLTVMRILKRPIEEKIFFAGEYLPANTGFAYGFAHGAGLSGAAAAKEIVSAHYNAD